MQSVSSTFLTALQSSSRKLTWVLEFYHQDAVPGASGFDPASADFLFGFSKVKLAGETDGITFRTQSFDRKILSIGAANKKIGKQLNTFTCQLSNMSREMWEFERDFGFEGLICVARIIDWDVSTALADSMIVFIGRCEKVQNFERRNETASLTVKQIVNANNTDLLRRTFSPNDVLGRSPSDPLFEGFRFTERNGSVQFEVKVKKRFLFFFSRTKTEKRTLQYSSHSDAQSSTFVPLIGGRVQAPAILLGYEDVGTQINFTAAFCDGYENGIAGFEDIRSVTPGFPATISNEKLGLEGGTGNQTNSNPSWVAAGVYSRTAYIDGYATGSELSEDDPAPELVAVNLGVIIPTPDGSGDFVNKEWSDNPIEMSRWVLNSKYIYNLADAWFDDVDILENAQYCDHVLVDTANTDTVLLPTTQQSFSGIFYKNYLSTGYLSPDYFDWSASGGTERFEPALLEVDPEFYEQTPYNSDDYGGTGSPSFAYGGETAKYRRRYTSNFRIAEQMKAADFLDKILFPSANLYLAQNANGKISIRVNKPVDTTFIKTASIATDDEIIVSNVMPWIGNFGRILIGANLATSEVRTIDGYSYSAGGQTITASGGVSSSAATLTGGSSTVAPNATLTVSTNTGTKTVTIAGYALTYASQSGDTTTTIAGILAGIINSHPVLNKSIKATWNKNATILVQSREGTLELDSALENAHATSIADPTTAPTATLASGGDLDAGEYLLSYSYDTGTGETLTATNQTVTVAANQNIVVTAITPPAGVTVNWYISVEPQGVRLHKVKNNSGASFTISKANLPGVNHPPEPNVNLTAEEVHHVAMAFSDKAETQSALTASNMIKGSFSFPHGNRQPSINQVEIKFRDASQDFELTTLTINDLAHQAKVKKLNKMEIDGAAIDNHHQARRIANQALNANREGDFFHGFTSDGEALLLEEGDVICTTDESGEFVNEPIRVEDVSITDPDGYPQISIKGRRYRRWFYDDQSTEKVVPIPIVSNAAPNRETEAPTIVTSDTPTNTAVNLTLDNYSKDARFLKWELDKVDTFDGGDYESFIVSAETNALKEFNPTLAVAKSTGEASAEAWHIRVAPSTNGETFGNASDSVEITFADSGDSGGIGLNAPPSSLQVLWDESNDEADLSWIRGGGSAAQTVQRKLNTESAASWADVTTAVGSGATTYSQSITKSSGGAIVYNYRVKDNDIDGWSNTASVTAPKADGAPSLAGVWDEAGTEIDLTITPDGGSGNYTIEHKTTGSYTSLVVQAGTTYSHSRTKGGSPVNNYYRVKRATPSGLYSNEVTVQVPGTASAPTLDSATWDDPDTELDITFTNDGGASNVTVQYSPAGADAYDSAVPDLTAASGSGSVTVAQDEFGSFFDIRLYQSDTGYSNVLTNVYINGTDDP